jgi:hypothetical protein
MQSTTSVEIGIISAPISFAIQKNEASFIAVTDRRSPVPADDADAAGTEAQRLRFAAHMHAALPGGFVCGDDFSRDVGVIVSAYDFPAAFIFGTVPRF